MSNDDQSLDVVVEAMAGILGVELTETSMAAVIMHLDIAFKLAPAFMEFPLGDEAEPAPVFTP